MPDGVLSIGAVFDKARLEGDFESAAEVVRAATDSWNTSFESSKKATRDAMEAMSASIKQMGAQATPVSIAYADSLRRVAEAQRQVRQANILMRDSTVDSGQAALAAMAAQRNLADAQAESAAAVMAFTEEQATAARESELSSNVIVAGFERVAMAAREAGAAMMTEAGEALAAFKSEGIMGGVMSMINGPMMAAMAGGMFVHFIDGIADVGMELEHLHIQTGISVQDLAGLREMAKETKTDFDAVGTGIVRMEKNLADSIPPSKQLQEALAGINLKISDLQGLSPEEKLAKIAAAFAGTENEGNRAAAAIAIFGRGGRALIPILTEEGAAITDNMHRIGEQTGYTDEAAKAAQQWETITAQLSMTFHGMMVPALQGIVGLIHDLQRAMDHFAAGWLLVSEAAASGTKALADSFVGLGKVAQDAFTLNWGQISADWKAGNAQVVQDFKEAWQNILIIGRADADSIAEIGRTPKITAPSGAATDEGSGPAPGGVAGGGGGGTSAAGGPAGAGAATGEGIWLQRLSVIPNDLKQQAIAIQELVEPAWKQLDLTVGKSVNDQMAEMHKLTKEMQQTSKVVLQMRTPWQRFEMDVKKVFQQIETDMKKTMQKMVTEFNASIAKWIVTGKGFQQSMANILRGMTEALIEQLMLMGEKWLAHELMVRAQHLLTSMINKSADTAAAAASQATTAAANVANVISNTAVAASGAAASQASIPIVGPALAVGAASAMEGLGAGWVSQAAFDTGGIMPHMGMGYNMSGSPERVLSPSQTRTFESLVNNNNGGNRSARLNQTNHFGSGVTPEMLTAHTNKTMAKLRGMLRPEAFR